jgi:ABC-type antimicrobial peptide transport system permease subunit
MNIMLATVTERTKEIGIRRALGARQRDIAWQFLTEALILTTIGGLIGIVAGVAAAVGVSIFAGWPTAITGYAVALPILLSLLVGIFFGYYPARKAAEMNPITALRHNA